jgi:hypothetical protein
MKKGHINKKAFKKIILEFPPKFNDLKELAEERR